MITELEKKYITTRQRAIPPNFIKRRVVDFDGELLSCLGGSIVCGKLKMRPIVQGVLSLCELMGNRFIHSIVQPQLNIKFEVFDLVAVMYLNHHRENAIEEVREYANGFKDPLEKKIQKFIEEFKFKYDEVDYIQNCVYKLIAISEEGLIMIPGGGGSSGMDQVYGARSISFISSVCCKRLGVNYKELIWETPLTLIGHTIAQYAIESGTTGVERILDDSHIAELRGVCDECDLSEEIYPWQEKFPFQHPELMSYQSDAQAKKWKAAAEKYIELKGEMDGRNKAEIERVMKAHKTLHSNYMKELRAYENKIIKNTNQKKGVI